MVMVTAVTATVVAAAVDVDKVRAVLLPQQDQGERMALLRRALDTLLAAVAVVARVAVAVVDAVVVVVQLLRVELRLLLSLPPLPRTASAKVDDLAL